MKKHLLKMKQEGRLKHHIEVDFKVKEVKEVKNDEGEFFVFEGFASTFGNVDHDGDIMVPGCFKESLERRTPVVLWQHNSREPIGMPTELKETDQGLFVVARMPKEDTFVSGRVVPQMRVGSVTKMSIGFFNLDSEDEIVEGRRITMIKKVELFEFSLVTFPANEQASVTAMKCLQEIDSAKSLRTYLSDELGLSIKERDTLISKIKSYFGSDDLEEVTPAEDDVPSDEEDQIKALESAIMSIKGQELTDDQKIAKAIQEINNG